VAENERTMISERTKIALQAAKARGQKLGGYRGRAPTAADRAKAVLVKQAKALARVEQVLPLIRRLQAEGVTTLVALAERLNGLNTQAPRGGTWQRDTVANALKVAKTAGL
jgi:DNA invertase Pin-like site-specific DNA recombinase